MLYILTLAHPTQKQTVCAHAYKLLLLAYVTARRWRDESIVERCIQKVEEKNACQFGNGLTIYINFSCISSDQEALHFIMSGIIALSSIMTESQFTRNHHEPYLTRF